MKRCKTSSRRKATVFTAAVVIAVTGSVFAQSVDQVLQADLRRLSLAQASQERINSVAVNEWPRQMRQPPNLANCNGDSMARR